MEKKFVGVGVVQVPQTDCPACDATIREHAADAVAKVFTDHVESMVTGTEGTEGKEAMESASQAVRDVLVAHGEHRSSSTTFDMGAHRPTKPLTPEEREQLRLMSPFTRPMVAH
jgi:hypothetical protein